jgi:hypothetical protein
VGSLSRPRNTRGKERYDKVSNEAASIRYEKKKN